jgi:amino-acid N-acetyltransferase
VNVAIAVPSLPTPAARAHRARPVRRPARVSYRAGTAADAAALFALIDAHVAEGHLLARRAEELATHAARFVVAERRGRLIACAELAPLSGRVAEVRSLVVDREARGLGIGRALVDALHHRATRDGFETLCAFTHDARFFVRLGFSLVPHTWLPEKIAHDCVTCPQFRRCGQHAVIRPLTTDRRSRAATLVPLARLEG